MGQYDQQVFDALLRTDLRAFIAKTFGTVVPGTDYQSNWHIELIADRLMQCAIRKITRLIITVPPRSLKSICASVAFPAWVLGNDPTRRIICASYTNELAIKHARDCKSVIEANWYRRAFHSTRLARSAELDLETTQKGGRYATSLGGTLTGRGGNILILDDPIKPQDALSETKRNAVNQWYDNTLYSRLDDKAHDVIIIVMQRVHMDDLVTHVKDKEHWEHLNLPAIAEVPETFTFSTGKKFERQPDDVLQPNRESREVLDSIKSNIGDFNFTTQYQQRPIPLKGNLIKREWLQYYDNMPPVDQADHLVQSWDTAGTTSELSSYSVCSTWRLWGDDYYLVDVFRERMDYPTLRKTVHRLALMFHPTDILIEEKATGTSLLQEMQADNVQGIPYPTAILPKEDKVIRMSTASHLIESGHVFFLKEATWLPELINEIFAFPYGKHDDQVDSISQFLNWIDERHRNTINVVELYGL